jgi:hypothetical protein
VVVVSRVSDRAVEQDGLSVDEEVESRYRGGAKMMVREKWRKGREERS